MGTYTTGAARRLTTAATATGCMLCLATGAALAQDPYPPEEVEVVVTTPSAVIEIRGDNWEPGTVVEIQPRSQQGRDGTATDAEPITATVADDGTFSAPVEVPDDAVEGDLQYEVVGTAADGSPREEVRTFTVQTVASQGISGAPFEPAPAEDQTAGWVVAGAAAAVAGGGLALRRRRRTEV